MYNIRILFDHILKVRTYCERVKLPCDRDVKLSNIGSMLMGKYIYFQHPKVTTSKIYHNRISPITMSAGHIHNNVLEECSYYNYDVGCSIYYYLHGEEDRTGTISCSSCIKSVLKLVNRVPKTKLYEMHIHSDFHVHCLFCQSCTSGNCELISMHSMYEFKLIGEFDIE